MAFTKLNVEKRARKSDWQRSAHLGQQLAKGGAKGGFKGRRLQLGGGFAATGGHVNNCKRIRRVTRAALDLRAGSQWRAAQAKEGQGSRTRAVLTSVRKHQRLRALLAAEKKALHHA